MQLAPRVKPISKLRTQHMDVMRMLKDGPVFLAQRGTVAAAIVAIEEWDRIARRMAELEGALQAKRALERFDAGLTSSISHDELKRLMQEAAHVGN